jgi:hypothetical protein
MMSWMIRIEGQQRRRRHADAGEAAFAEAEERHRRDGRQVEQRVGDHVQMGACKQGLRNVVGSMRGFMRRNDNGDV